MLTSSRAAFALLMVALLVSPAPAQTTTAPGPLTIPYVATRNDMVRDMLWLAEVAKGDVVYDLGSGDGRIVIAAVRDFGAARAVGVEKNPELIRRSRENARQAGVADRVEFIQGDLFAGDFHEASVVTLFLGHQPNIKLRPKLFAMLKSGTRIVSHQFNMGEWPPDKLLSVRTVLLGMCGTAYNPFSSNPAVPDYQGNERDCGNGDTISMWVVPAGFAGVWRGKVETSQGMHDLEMVLHQGLSMSYGGFRLSGPTELQGGIGVDAWGDKLRFSCQPSGLPHNKFELRFDGQVSGDTMTGTFAVVEDGRAREQAWEARRDPADYTGTWEWPRAAGSRLVGLRIEQRDGQFTAAYIDRGRETPVEDFYDFGGGFYFTHLIGRHASGGLEVTDDTGWLIGHAVLEGDTVTGRVAFYPYTDGPPTATRPASTAWEPRRVQP